MTTAEQFAAILKHLRESKGISQSDLAERSGVSVRTIQQYERGAREPSWSAVCKLARGLKVKLTVFALPE